MAIVVSKHVLGDVSVKDAMRKQVVRLPADADIGKAIRFLTKHKVNALLVTGSDDMPIGVVSKTDVVGAYYAGLPLESPLEHIMVGPPIVCTPDDSLEAALETMRSSGVYRLYVAEHDGHTAIGVLAYPDIVGLLYRYCRECDRSTVNRSRNRAGSDDIARLFVKDVMTPHVTAFTRESSVEGVIEGLSSHRFGAVLITDASGRPAGVVSKTDLILAYLHGLPTDALVDAIPLPDRTACCSEDNLLEEAIRKMILSDVRRLFVYRESPDNVIGVFSLSDAARARSGSCHACVSSRIRVEDAG